MRLPPRDVARFFKLQRALLFFVNQRLQVLPDPVASPDAVAFLTPEVLVKLRDALPEHPELIESFVEENPAHLPDDELAIVRSRKKQRKATKRK